MFAFISMGGWVDTSTNWPYVFRMSGENYHHIGSLLPEVSIYMILKMKLPRK